MAALLKDERYGATLNSYDLLKLVALFSMILDHAGSFFFPEMPSLRVLGRVAFPVFFFLIGYSRSTRIDRELIIYTLLLYTLNAASFASVLHFNILATVIVTRLALRSIDKRDLFRRFPMEWFFALLILWPASILFFDYGSVAVMFGLCGRLVRDGIDSRAQWVFVWAVLVFHLAVQQYSFHFSPLEGMAMSTLLLGTFIALLHFRIVPVEIRKGANWLKLLSRQSLAIYALHLAAFHLAETLLYPARNLTFHWL